MPKTAASISTAHRVHPAAFWMSLFLGLLLQVTLPIEIPLAHLFDFPLVLTLYYAMVRRDKIFGTILGTGLGLAQDALARGLIGLFGIGNALVGYLAAGASLKFELDQMGTRYVVTAVLVSLHALVILAMQHLLFESPPRFAPLDWASGVIVNVALALICYPILDRFRRPA
jgi:rod shape-determining protein MreD